MNDRWGRRREGGSRTRPEEGGGAVFWLVVLLVSLSACTRPHPFVTRTDGGDSVVIRNVRVFDSPRAALLPGLRDVVVRDGRIVDVAPPGVESGGDPEIDGEGGTLLPGLVDVHVHVGGSASRGGVFDLPKPEENLAAFLYAGVTTVLDLGGLTPDVFRLRDEVRAGRVLGPALYAAGPMFTAPGGHPGAIQRLVLPRWIGWYVVPRFTREVETAAEGRAAVEALQSERPDVVKIAIDRVPQADTPRLDDETIAAVVSAAHESGLRAVAHVGRSPDAIDAVRAGVDALVHAVYLEEMSEEAVAAVASAGIPVVATLSIFDAVGGSLGGRDGRLPIEREIAGAALEAIDAARPPAELEPYVRDVAEAREVRARTVARLRNAGVPILAGSDSAAPGHLPGAGIHVELRKLVEAGLTPGEALRTATWENARFLEGDAPGFGEVAPGRRADLVLVAGDPVADVSAIGRIEQVFLGGVRLERRARPK